MKKIRIYIIDCAVSIVPKHWKKYPIVNHYIEKYNRYPLINASIHQKYLKGTVISQRNDRPDILHFGLLTVLGYSRIFPNLEVYFSIKNKLYKIDKETRIPRDQRRFYGMIETLLNGNYSGNLIQEVNFPHDFYKQKKILFTKEGQKEYPVDFISENNDFIFGGFSTGSVKTDLGENISKISLADGSLEIWTALSMVLNILLPN